MKKIDTIREKRKQRFFDKRMEKADVKNKADRIRELMKHSDLIEDPDVKAYIKQKISQKEKKGTKGAIGKAMKVAKDMEMVSDEELMSSESEMEVEPVKAVAKVKKITKKAIKKRA